MNNSFLTADGTWCVVMPDRLIFNQPVQELVFEPAKGSFPNKQRNFLGILGLLIIAGFFTWLHSTDRMLFELWLLVVFVCLGASYSLFLKRDTSSALVIDRSTITSTKLVSRQMGYTTLILYFTAADGKKLRRYVKLYDSKDHETKALALLKQEGLLK